MNGRVYDYNLGRFLSVDPFIQEPGNSQSMNPYSYIMNNPLAGTDPSGYFSAPGESGSFLGLALSVASGEGFTEEQAQMLADVESASPLGNDHLQGASEAGASLKIIIATGSLAAAAEYVINKAKNGDISLRRNKNRKLGQVPVRNGNDSQMNNGSGDPSKIGDRPTDQQLENRAKEIHGALDSRAQDRRTTAVTEAEASDGSTVLIVSSSEKRLTPAQRRMLKSNEVEGQSPSVKQREHAEMTGIREAKEAGLKPTRTAASRGICDNCAGKIKQEGVKPASPLKNPEKDEKDKNTSMFSSGCLGRKTECVN